MRSRHFPQMKTSCPHTVNPQDIHPHIAVCSVLHPDFPQTQVPEPHTGFLANLSAPGHAAHFQIDRL